jgi:hypothetical protein
MMDDMDGDEESRPSEVGLDASDEEVLPGRQWSYRWRRLWWMTFGAAIVVIAVILAIQSGGRTRQVQPTSRPSASSAPTSGTSTPASGAPTTAPAVTVTELGHPLFGITASWDLFARGSATMLRIEFAHGRITRSVVPALASNGPVSFLAAPHAAIIRPLDFVPGYLVPDGRPPHALTGALASGGVLLPGPISGQFWMQSGQGGATAPMALVGADGHPIASPHSAHIVIPPTMTSFPAPDGGGYSLVTGPDGVYDMRPSGLHRITTGAVVAVGPTRWLAAECTRQAQCFPVVVDQATGARHALHSFISDPSHVSGVISPDGHTAALLLPENIAGGPPLLHLINLSTGTDRPIAVQFNQNVSAFPFPDDAVVWSPDSRWLFAVDMNGQLHALDARTGRGQSLGVPLPPVEQLAIR